MVSPPLPVHFMVVMMMMMMMMMMMLVLSYSSQSCLVMLMMQLVRHPAYRPAVTADQTTSLWYAIQHPYSAFIFFSTSEKFLFIYLFFFKSFCLFFSFQL